MITIHQPGTMELNRVVYFDQAGVYEPTVHQWQITWQRNDVDPLVGIFIGSVEVAQQMGTVEQAGGGYE